MNTYDGLGRIRSVTGPDGTTVQTHYENPELPSGSAGLGTTQAYQVHVTAASGAEMKVAYDVINRETQRSVKDFTGAAFNIVTTAYDPFHHRAAFWRVRSLPGSERSEHTRIEV